MQTFDVKTLFDVIFFIVNEHYLKKPSSGVGILASDIAIARNKSGILGQTSWEDWLKIIAENRNLKIIPKTLNIEESYDAAIRFLSYNANRIESISITECAEQLTFKKWKQAVEKISKKSNYKT